MLRGLGRDWEEWMLQAIEGWFWFFEHKLLEQQMKFNLGALKTDVTPSKLNLT